MPAEAGSADSRKVMSATFCHMRKAAATSLRNWRALI
jgi:hypothetical protein